MSKAEMFILILLSVGLVMADEAKPLECFWCGPYANQVHRSTRPPPCEGPGNHYMLCEQQYTNCATVYSSPPHMESRVCTKTYSEECYTEFCNTTRTWKITCPCKGNMCNVRDKRRERELFDILNHLVDKTFKNYRTKRQPFDQAQEKGTSLFEDMLMSKTGRQVVQRVKRQVGSADDYTQSLRKEFGIESDEVNEAGEFSLSENVRERLMKLENDLDEKVSPNLDNVPANDMHKVTNFPWFMLHTLTKNINSSLSSASMEKYPFDKDPYGLLTMLSLMEDIVYEGPKTSDDNFKATKWAAILKQLDHMANIDPRQIKLSKRSIASETKAKFFNVKSSANPSDVVVSVTKGDYSASTTLDPTSDNTLPLLPDDPVDAQQQTTAKQTEENVAQNTKMNPKQTVRLCNRSDPAPTMKFEITNPVKEETQQETIASVAQESTAATKLESAVPITQQEAVANLPKQLSTTATKQESTVPMMTVTNAKDSPVYPTYNTKDILQNRKGNKNEGTTTHTHITALSLCIVMCIIY